MFGRKKNTACLLEASLLPRGSQTVGQVYDISQEDRRETQTIQRFDYTQPIIRHFLKGLIHYAYL